MIPFKLIVLLSSYNGEKYIKEQIESILSQTYNNFDLIIRDDGSTDNTIKIIESFEKDNKNIILFKGDNLGVVRSFLELLKNTVCGDEEIVLFCDQDDVWMENKLLNIVESMSAAKDHNNTLYCSRLRYVDTELKPMGLTQIPKNVNFNNAVVENIAIGCTMAFGKNIRERVLQADPEHMMMHDWWTYLVASAFGEVIFDARVGILYRQHPGSVTAYLPGLLKLKFLFEGLIKRLLDKQQTGLQSLNQAIHFIDTYENIPDKHRRVVKKLVELRGRHQIYNRFKYILRPDVHRNSTIENIAFKPLVLFGWH